MSAFNLEQYEQAKQGTVFLPLPERAIWRFTGKDRVRYLNGQVTQDVKTLLPGQTRYAAVISAKGRLQGDVWISATDDALLVDAPFELRETLGPRLERYIVADDVLLEDCTGHWKIFQRFVSNSFPAPDDSLTFPSRRFGLEGRDYWISKEGDFLTPPQPVLVDFAILEILRIENALPEWGREMNENTLPPEVRLDELATSYNKGCYIGQEVIARLKSIGHVNKHLCLLEAVDPETPLSFLPSPLILQGKEVGHLTSACFSPSRNRPLALGIVSRAASTEGNVLESAGHSWKIEVLPS